MNRDVFDELVRDLNSYFGSEKTVSPRRADQWFYKVKDIPEASIDFIYNKITNERDAMPRNLPKYIISFYFQWRSSSDQVINYPVTHCDECNSKGFLWVKRPSMINGTEVINAQGEKMMEEISFRCASCENWRREVNFKSKPSATLSQLSAQGYDVVGFENKQFGSKPQNYNNVVDSIGVAI